MRLLTGAEATLVVNNNAAAVLLTLAALAAGRSVVVSRGEAIEIGGGFRVPDVLRQSGATLVEVGTTNRTYARDYAAAIDERTAVLLKVHPSNFRISGFTAAAGVPELVAVAAPHGIPVVEDLGSGALLDTRRFGLASEPTIEESLSAGAAVATASGDKLLGGPQAGLIVGQREWLARIAAHPLARAVRADKTCLAGLAATLRHYARGEAETRVPVWRMIAAAPEDIRRRAEALARSCAGEGIDVLVRQTESTVGGGSLPGQMLPSAALAFAAADGRAELDLAKRLRLGEPRVFGRIEDRAVLLDLRSVLPEDDERLRTAVAAALRDGAPAS
jgi:L-seryl-tRNA(Ser) seleniumtransferase